MVGGAWIAPILLICCLQAEAAGWKQLSDGCVEVYADDASSGGGLADACPQLAQALRADPWGELLIISPDDVTPWMVLDLAAIVDHYQRPIERPGLDPAALDAVLAGLPDSTAVVPRSWWERLLEWLWEQGGDGRRAWPAWLENLSLPEGAVAWIWYGSVTVIVLLAAFVVINEVRQQTRRRHAANAPTRARLDTTGAEVSASLGLHSPKAELEALFRLLVDGLQSAGLIPRRPSLTHRQIAAAGALSPRQREIVGAISHAAERVVYGAWEPAPEDVRPHLESGRLLLDGLGSERVDDRAAEGRWR